MREFFYPVLVGVAVALAWTVVWSAVLHIMGYPCIAPSSFLSKMSPVERRERIKTMGKSRYYLFYGLLGPGVGFALGMACCHLVENAISNWTREAIEFVLIAILFSALRPSWRQATGETVPYPPKYD